MRGEGRSDEGERVRFEGGADKCWLSQILIFISWLVAVVVSRESLLTSDARRSLRNSEQEDRSQQSDKSARTSTQRRQHRQK